MTRLRAIADACLSRHACLALSLVVLVLGACRGDRGAGAQPPAATRGGGQASSLGVPAFSHAFVIVLENKESEQVLGNARAPYLNGLAAQGARLDAMYAIRHPSLPNYLALTGGNTFGVTSDCTSCFIDAPNIATQLEDAGRSWKAYMEGMPRPCYLGNGGARYAQKHNPFIYYDAIRTNPDRCAKIVPFDHFSDDLAAGALPDFVWITPDMCHSMHDCSVSDGDAWLAIWVPRILASPAWQDAGVLFITFDEGSSNAGCCADAAGGHIPTLILSPLIRPGTTSQTAYDHYSLLRTIEEGLGLPPLANAACDCSPAITDIWTNR